MLNYSDYKVGIIKFISDIGYSTFSIIRNGTSILNFTIEVFPSKIDYKSDYQEIIKEINNAISALSFDKSGKTYLNLELKYTNNQSDTEYINIFMSIFESLENDIKSICRQPKVNIETVEVICTIEKSRHIANKTAKYLRKHQNTLIEAKDGLINLTGNNKAYLPTKVIDNRKIATINIYENQYVEYIITSIIKRLESIEKNIINASSKDSSILISIKEKRTVLERYIKVYFKEVSDLPVEKSMDLRFQISSEYRRLIEKYNLLKKSLIIGGNSFQITPKKIYKLYEIWCYLKINHLLVELGCVVKSNTIFKYSDNGYYLSLLEGEEGKFVYQKGSKEIELWYNKSYSSLPTTKQKPDIVLGIKNIICMDERFYIFDAKYRIKSEISGGEPMEEDINVMHRYRDSIVSRMDNGKGFKYDIVGAYVLFPCFDEKLFVNNKFYRSIDEVNIGALPMLPGNIGLMKVQLERIIGVPVVGSQGHNCGYLRGFTKDW